MEPLLRDAIDRLCSAHGIGSAARRDLEDLVEALVDPRLQFTEGPSSAAAQATEVTTAFEDLGLIGRGGMGEVRRVRETALGRVVAMKILRAGADPTWFDREARLTAALDHPGVLPLFGLGRLADGRPFFTLREAEGQTLREALDEPQGRTQRRLLDALRRVAETVASAHARGFVHRDLKPENILLGAFGAVWVLDWGIAGPAGETLRAATGSPRYMAPEQARGEALGPPADVWALGALLTEILSGRPAFPGDADAALAAILRGPPAPLGPPADPGLSAIAASAMAFDPGDRTPDGAAFADALGAWLDGAQARDEAMVLLARAQALFEGARRDRAEADRLRVEAAHILAEVPTWAPPEDKQEAWRLEDRARDTLFSLTLDEEQATELAQQALQRCPDLREGHQLLAAHYRARLEEAEASGDPVGPRLEARLRAHDTGEQTRWLQGEGALNLVTDPPGALVRAARLVEVGRRRVPGPFQTLGTTPLYDVPLARGSWLLEITAEGRHPVRYPVMIDRSSLWDGVPPGGTEPWPIWLPPKGEIGPDEVYVPAGWTTVGGDPKAVTARPAQRVWIDAFVIQRFAMSNRDYLAYVNRLTAEEGIEVARPEIPFEDYGETNLPNAYLYTWTGDRWDLQITSNGRVWVVDFPVFLISRGQAETHAAWKARWTGQPWRLMSRDEHEKASRGVDRRIYPWGDEFDFSFPCITGAYPGPQRIWEVDSFPLDESIYGVRGMIGCIRHWVNTPDPNGRVESCGSSWNSGAVSSRSTSAFTGFATQRTLGIGCRLVRSVP